MDCVSLCTEVLFNHHPSVKQLNVLLSDSAYPSVHPDDLASWWNEGLNKKIHKGNTVFIINDVLLSVRSSPHKCPISVKSKKKKKKK